jgi:hypothetical protein
MSHFDPGIIAEISTGSMNLSRALARPSGAGDVGR